MKLALLIYLLSCTVALFFPVRSLWRTWQHHRRFMSVMHDCDRAIEAMKRSRTTDQLKARWHRAQEILEHGDQIRKDRP